MANYLILHRFTDQGAKTIKESAARIEVAKQLYRKFNAEVKEFYGMMGQYDTAVLVSAPDDEAVAKACLAVGALGNVHSETHRIYTEGEWKKITQAMP